MSSGLQNAAGMTVVVDCAAALRVLVFIRVATTLPTTTMNTIRDITDMGLAISTSAIMASVMDTTTVTISSMI